MGQEQPIDLLLIIGEKHFTKGDIEERKVREIKALSEKVIPNAYLLSNLKK